MPRTTELLRECRDVLEKELHTHGHSHWDDTMQHGAGCLLCIAQRETGGWDMLHRIDAHLAQPEAAEPCGAHSVNLGCPDPEQGWMCPDCGDVTEAMECPKGRSNAAPVAAQPAQSAEPVGEVDIRDNAFDGHMRGHPIAWFTASPQAPRGQYKVYAHPPAAQSERGQDKEKS